MDLVDLPSDYRPSDTARDIEQNMTRLVAELGMAHYSFMFLKPPSGNSTSILDTLHTSYPKEWTDRYKRHKYWEIDPVADLGQRVARPFIWGQGRFLQSFEKSQRVVFDEADAFDIKYGLTIPTRGPQGELSVFNLVSPHKAHLYEVLHDAIWRVYLAAVDTHERVLNACLASGDEDAKTEDLSPRERECLSWTLEGKTAGDVATILGISVSTVNHHVSSAAKKLGSLNKHHAAVQALRLGLI